MILSLLLVLSACTDHPTSHGVRQVTDPYHLTAEQVSILQPVCDQPQHCRHQVAYQGSNSTWYVYTYYDTSAVYSTSYQNSSGKLDVPMGGVWASTTDAPPATLVASTQTVSVSESTAGAPAADNDQGGPAGGGDVDGPGDAGASAGDAGSSGGDGGE